MIKGKSIAVVILVPCFFTRMSYWRKQIVESKKFIIGKIGHENVFENILENKKAFQGYKNKKLIKLKNWDFSKGVSPWFWSKIGNFSTFVL